VTVARAIPLDTLLSVLRCPACASRDWQRASGSVRCAACGGAHDVRNGILTVRLAREDAEVLQERASVPATEEAPELGGWRERADPLALDPLSSLGQAYLSLPAGSDSPHFQEPGYFQNVQRFATEFAFILRHLPPRGLLLDMGADGTWSTAALARRGFSCIALDITDHLALAHLFQTACPPYALVNVDMHAPVFADASLDVVTAFNAMHHSKRLDALAANVARILKPGGVLAFIEPYVQNAAQEAAFGAPQSACGINENVHTVQRWHDALTRVGLDLVVFSLSDSFNAVYRKPEAGDNRSTAVAADVMAGFYASALEASPAIAHLHPGTPFPFVVRVESRGRAAWASRGPMPLRVSYHVSRVTPAGPVMRRWDNERTLLHDFVCPKQPATLTVPVVLDEPGEYEIEFDLVHETRTWFGEAGGQTARVRAKVGQG
jgi:SAM-dependent methyltransferase